MTVADPLLAGNTLVAVITLSSARLTGCQQRRGLQAHSKTGAYQESATITVAAVRSASLLTMAKA
jgi:hypothetical protein